MGHYILHFSLCHGMWPEMPGHKYHHRWQGAGGLRYGLRHGSCEGGGSQKGAPTTPRARKPFFFHPGSADCKVAWERVEKVWAGGGLKFHSFSMLCLKQSCGTTKGRSLPVPALPG